jgi:hypothetical protein
MNLFDPRTADAAVIDYVTIANCQASLATAPEQK